VFFVVYVPLDEVRKVWLGPKGRGLYQLKTAGLHSRIYQDVFGHTFWPLGVLEVSYSNSHQVTWGDMIDAKNTTSPPSVQLPTKLNGEFATLVLSDPDSHLQESSQELLHWMV